MNDDGRGLAAAVGIFLVGAAAVGIDRPPALTAQEPGATCSIVSGRIELPAEVHETSGLAVSRRTAGLFWTHNDKGNDAELFAISEDGALVQRVRVDGAEAVDWEDLEGGACDAGSCLYIGDIGDNDAARERITVYRIAEPAEGATESAPAEAFHARYPEGARDAEALLLGPSGDLFIVTKGRRGPVELYRFPLTTPGETVTLEHVRDLLPAPASDEDRVTAATATADGRWAAVRSYRSLYLYSLDALISGEPAEPTIVDLTPLGQMQGESIALRDDGTGWVTTEAEDEGSKPAMGRLRCTLPD